MGKTESHNGVRKWNSALVRVRTCLTGKTTRNALKIIKLMQF